MRNLVVVFFLVAVCAAGVVQGELKSVALLFRHGERTPASVMPKYGDSEILRELGLGELTLKGSQQSYENGVTLSNQYKRLFPKSGYFRTSNMKITSSSSNRCIATLTSFMAGFMPPPANDKTIPLRWQAFPFAVDNEARILSIDPTACSSYLADYMKVFGSIEADPTVRSWLAEDKPLLDKLSVFVGKPLTTFTDAFMSAETIRTQQFLAPPTPQWVLDALVPLRRYMVRYFDLFHETELMRKVRGGPMLTQVVDNMVAVANNNATAKKVILQSAHDLSLSSMVAVLDVKDQVPPIAAYSDTIAIELHQNGVNEPEVQIYYISSTTAKKLHIPLRVPNCGTPCKLSTFTNVVSKYLVRDYNAMCKV